MANSAKCFLLLYVQKYFEKTEFVTGAGHLTRDDVHRLIENLNTKNETEYAAEINSVVFNNSKAWGQSVASAVQAWAKTDLGYEGELNPLNNDPSKPMYYDFKKEFYDANGNLKRPGMWQPTNDNPDAGMFPRWGETRTLQQVMSKSFATQYHIAMIQNHHIMHKY